jgi:hypothetical protein
MLHAARADDPVRHRSAVVRVEASAFAPSTLLLRDLASGAIDGAAFARRYVWELRQLWQRDRQTFLDVIELATRGTDCTITDDYGDSPHAPRRILTAALKQTAASQRAEAKRKARLAASRASTSPTPGNRLTDSAERGP